MKKIRESKVVDLSFQIVWVNNLNSVSTYLTSKNYKKAEDQVEEAYDLFLKDDPTSSDDFWIDDIMLIKGDIDTDKGIVWKDILALGRERLDQDAVDAVYEDPEIAIKIQYLVGLRDDVDLDSLEDIEVYDNSRGKVEYSNDKAKYPTDWLYEYAESVYDDLYKKLEHLNFLDYFDWANVARDDDINGTLLCDWIGDYFIVDMR